MEPTFRTNNILMTERFTKHLLLYERGDIIIAKSPAEPKTLVCKRIVGLPGDKIEIKARYTWNPFRSTKSVVIADENEKGKENEKENPIPVENLFKFIDEIDDLDEERGDQINNQTSSQRTFRRRVVYVPKGHVWVEGDNSENSLDSRNYGPVPMGLIQSRVFSKVYPFEEFSIY